MSKDKEGSGGGLLPDDGTAFKGAGSHIQHSIEQLIAKLVTTAAKITDIKQGREQLRMLLNSAFLSKFGKQLKRLERELADLEVEYVYTLDELAKIRDVYAVTPDFLPASRVNHGRDANEHVETPFADWQMRHRFETKLILLCLPIALGSSAYTAWANLVGTGLPVFLENPVLPISMAALAPMASYSFKTIWHSLHTDRARKLFTKALNWTAVGLIVVWSGLFADQFHGLSGNNVISDLFEAPSLWSQIKTTGFTAVTLLTEMTVGTLLAHRLDKIAVCYSPDYWVQNPNRISIRERMIELEARSSVQVDRIQALTGEIASYAHSLDLQINMALLSYDARRSRVEDDTL